MSDFISRLENHLRHHFGRNVIDIECLTPLSQWLADILSDASDYGFVSEKSQSVYVCVAATTQRQFMKERWAATIYKQATNPEECIHLIAAESVKRTIRDKKLSSSEQKKLPQVRQTSLLQQLYARHSDWLWKAQSQYGLNLNSRDELFHWFKKFDYLCQKYNFKRLSEASIFLDIYLSETQRFYEEPWAKDILTADETAPWRIMCLRSANKQRDFERYVASMKTSVEIHLQEGKAPKPDHRDIDALIAYYQHENRPINLELDFDALLKSMLPAFSHLDMLDVDRKTINQRILSSMQYASLLGAKGTLTLKALGASSLFQGLIDHFSPWMEQCLALSSDSLRAQAIKYYLVNVVRYKFRDAALLARADFNNNDYIKYDNLPNSHFLNAETSLGCSWTISSFSGHLYQRIKNAWPESRHNEMMNLNSIMDMIDILMQRFHIVGLNKLASAVTLGVLADRPAYELPAVVKSFNSHENNNWHPVFCDNSISRYFAQFDTKFWDVMIKI